VVRLALPAEAGSLRRQELMNFASLSLHLFTFFIAPHLREQNLLTDDFIKSPQVGQYLMLSGFK
jgi:hypothetical protein